MIDELEAIYKRHETDDKVRQYMGFLDAPSALRAARQAHADRATLLRALDAERARVAELEEALKPFARFLDVRENMRGLTGTADDTDDAPMFECSSSVNGTATLTVGDFRRARALKEIKP